MFLLKVIGISLLVSVALWPITMLCFIIAGVKTSIIAAWFVTAVLFIPFIAKQERNYNG